MVKSNIQTMYEELLFKEIRHINLELRMILKAKKTGDKEYLKYAKERRKFILNFKKYLYEKIK